MGAFTLLELMSGQCLRGKKVRKKVVWVSVQKNHSVYNLTEQQMNLSNIWETVGYLIL